MAVLAGVGLDGIGRAALRIAFTQHRVDGAAQALGIVLTDGLFFVGLRVFGELGQRVTLALQLLDRVGQLML